MAWSVAPYFIVDDVIAAGNYYRDQLGFSYERFWGDPPAFCMAHRGGVVIMLSQGGTPNPNRLRDREGDAWDAYVWVEDAAVLHDEYATRGVKIVRGLCEQIYGNLDFEVEDLNGYRLCFGSDLGAPASSPAG
jgi:uncharacterized glyoxalase superfamily protein PhnB